MLPTSGILLGDELLTDVEELSSTFSDTPTLDPGFLTRSSRLREPIPRRFGREVALTSFALGGIVSILDIHRRKRGMKWGVFGLMLCLCGSRSSKAQDRAVLPEAPAP